MSQNKNHRLVYATGGGKGTGKSESYKNACKMCGLDPCKCRTVQPVNPANVTIKIRLEKNGRGGKSVSVLFNLPSNPDYFTDLAKKLKSHCGSGGTFKDDQIEIQGDHRDKIKIYLEKLGFQVKLAGG